MDKNKLAEEFTTIQQGFFEVEYNSPQYYDSLIKKSKARKRVEDYLEDKRLRDNISEQ